MDPGELDGPCGCACIEACFSEALQTSAEVGASNAERKQVSASCEATADKAGEEGEFAAATIGKRTGYEAAEQRHDREDSDGIADCSVRTAEVVPDVWREHGQNCSHAEKTQERCGDERPETQAEAGGLLLQAAVGPPRLLTSILSRLIF